MTTHSFNAGWTVAPLRSLYAALQEEAPAGEPVLLPHDALIAADRSADSGEGARTGYFPGGAFEYRKTFDVPAEFRRRRVTLEFQGAYRDAVVFVNDVFAAQRPNGYATFTVPLDPYLRYGAPNSVRVQIRANQDSRWYSGVGLHRDARLHVADLVHVATGGVRITTPDVDDERAVVEIATGVCNEGLETTAVSIRTVVTGPDGTLACTDDAPVTLRAGQTATVRQRAYVDSPRRWSPDTPELYRAATVLTSDDITVDEVRTTFGIRTLRLDPQRGLRINDVPVKLRGACLHHDNGLLGAAAIAAAEGRRVRLLKEAGFNAIRSAHNPLSQPMLDECDRLGMLVMDEFSDVWTVTKTAHDYSLAFPEWWERDIEAMVAKDFNHPSVIMYSVGNENPETGTGLGAHWGRAMAEKIRGLDPTRYVTNGINGFVAAIDEVAQLMQQHTAAGDQGVNGAMNAADFMNLVSASASVTNKTAESFAALDVAGMNYGDARYELDKGLFPNRIIVGTETFPSHIAANWRLVEEHPHVLGDFTWTGWDYLGEAGAGRITYLDGDDVPTFQGDYPWLTSWTGDIDITGHRRPASYFRETVFRLRHEPYIAVQRPETFGRPSFTGQWAWSDTVSGWSWDTPAGSPTAVEVYSDADEVELLVNDRSLGRRPAGRNHGFKAVFDVVFEPGELTAVAITAGHERARTSLRSARGRLRLDVTAERTEVAADDRDLAFLPIVLRDEQGSLAHAADRQVTVNVDGPGRLLAVGSGRPDQNERFDTGRHTTFDGRALAIVRPTGTGTIAVTVTADDLDPVVVDLHAVPAAGSDALAAEPAFTDPTAEGDRAR